MADTDATSSALDLDLAPASAGLVRARRRRGAAAPPRVVATGRIIPRPLEPTRPTDQLAGHPAPATG